jgi:hypothetical protein
VKKLFVLALSVVFVLMFSAFAMADGATVLVGNVNAEYNTVDNIANGYGDVWAEFDLTKDFTEGWTGGLKFRAQPGKTADVRNKEDDGTATVASTDAVKFEGDGWIKYAADMWNVKFATGGSFGVGADLNAPDAVFGGQVGGQPNVEFNVIPMEGLTATLFLNEEADATTVPNNTDCVYNYGFKGVYDLAPLKVGVGYSAENFGTTADDNITTMGVFGSYKLLEDALTVGAEYQSRNFPAPFTDPAVGMKVYANYSKDALSAGFSYMTRSAAFYTKNDNATEAWSLADRFMDKSLFDITGVGPDPAVSNPYLDATSTRYLISINASYKVTEAITVGAVIDTTDVKYNSVNSAGTAMTDVTSGYKLYVSDQIVPDLTLEAGYQSFLDSKVYVKLSAKIN